MTIFPDPSRLAQESDTAPQVSGVALDLELSRPRSCVCQLVPRTGQAGKGLALPEDLQGGKQTPFGPGAAAGRREGSSSSMRSLSEPRPLCEMGGSPCHCSPESHQEVLGWGGPDAGQEAGDPRGESFWGSQKLYSVQLCDLRQATSPLCVSVPSSGQ